MIEQYERMERERIERNLAFAEQGVKFIDIKQAYIAEGTEIGEGTVIYPCVVIEGRVKIGKNCIIGQNSRIVDSEIADDVEIQSSVILESTVGQGTTVGPFAYMRPNSHVGRNCKVGDFVEIKNSNFGDGSKSSHLTYIGDADVGSDVNLGCGVVFVNYDGSNKYRTTVGNGAFIGCNTNLVSPVHVDDDAYIAAGSTVTTDVPSGALYVARNKGKKIEGWVERRGIFKKKKDKKKK